MTDKIDFHNPLGYYCSPNGATPDYVASYDLRSFLAYGMMLCDVREDDPRITHEDVYWLRKDFLDYMNNVVTGFKNDEPKDKGGNSWDASDGIIIGDEIDDKPEIGYRWAYARRNTDKTLLIEMWESTSGESSSFNTTRIWIAESAISNKRNSLQVIKKAEKVNEIFKES